ncbi:hypothetical protein GFH48_03980 [Streptomyces fagopyri]|uniref:Uncharacterized protein n=1 Tax=Streptomyces fagopyri TaxID=2662397 RepID=A0A5Q0L645_9ACTN|nr:hypothetical protein GFH48_03980 [Streptomyces fagopyri]
MGAVGRHRCEGVGPGRTLRGRRLPGGHRPAASEGAGRPGTRGAGGVPLAGRRCGPGAGGAGA